MDVEKLSSILVSKGKNYLGTNLKYFGACAISGVALRPSGLRWQTKKRGRQWKIKV